MQRIVIVGGGAGGLALATQLGRRLGKKGLAQITLVDAARTHVWKPLLHQLAAGSYDTHAEEIEYLAQAHSHHFKFRLGDLTGIDRQNKTVQLAASHDDSGREITPAQSLAYDTLVIAVGSQTNDFSTLGAAEHAIKLNTPKAARQLNQRLINACIRAQTVARTAGSGVLTVAIVGGGATGVELAAELHAAANVLASYGFDHIDPQKDLKIVLIEAAPRLLAQLPERLSESALRELRNLAIEVHTSEKVVEVTADSLKMASGKTVASTITVWAAGVKAADFLNSLGGDDPLETTRINQLMVNGNLQTTRDAAIYAFGDCAACQQPDGGWVPPRAQAGLPAGHVSGARAAAADERANRTCVRLPRPGLAGVAGVAGVAVGILVGRQSDGQPEQRQFFCRRPACQTDVLGLAQTAPAGARRIHENSIDHPVGND